MRVGRIPYINCYPVYGAIDRGIVQLNATIVGGTPSQLNERMGQFIATIEYDRILGPKARVARNLSWLFNKVLYPAMRTEIEISQEELGLLAGVSRPVVNKALQELEDEGLLRAEHGRITVFDLEKLSRFGPD